VKDLEYRNERVSGKKLIKERRLNKDFDCWQNFRCASASDWHLFSWKRCCWLVKAWPLLKFSWLFITYRLLP